MSNANAQKPFHEFIWPTVTLAFAAVVAVIYHASSLPCLIGGVVWGVGVAYQAYLYKQDNESMFPYGLQAIGALITAVWAATSQM